MPDKCNDKDKTLSILESINCVYKRAGYMEKYGTDIVITVFVFSVVFAVGSYYAVLNNLQPLKANWEEERCKPYVIPFASLINKPPDQTSMEYVVNNFDGCLKGLFSEIAAVLMTPIFLMVSILTTIMMAFSAFLQAIITLLGKIREFVINMFKDIAERIMSIMVPFLKLFQVIIGMQNRIGATFRTVAYGVSGVTYAFKSTVVALWNNTLIALGIAIAASFILLNPFTWPAFLVVFFSLVIIITILAIFSITLTNQMNLKHKPVQKVKTPPKPCSIWSSACDPDDDNCCGECKKNIFGVYACT
jgi:hypothetical protein